MVKIGYARVSTKDQNLDMQIKALKKAGCVKIYTEKMSGKKRNRPVLNSMLKQIKPGDTIVIWKIDRIARSATHMCEITDKLKKKKVVIISITDGIDTSTPFGEIFIKFAGVFAEMEISNRRERTIEGIRNARNKGKTLGRPAGPSRPEIVDTIRTLKKKGMNNKDIISQMNISYATFYRYKKLI